VTPPTISRWVNGGSTIPPLVIEKLRRIDNIVNGKAGKNSRLFCFRGSISCRHEVESQPHIHYHIRTHIKINKKSRSKFSF
jgi:hypothetical protein